MNKATNILILGGSGVIGSAIAKEFGQRGWSVGIHYCQNLASATTIASTMEQSTKKAVLYQMDVNDPFQIKALFQSFLLDHGSLTLLVWAIGIAPSKLLIKTTSEEWDQTLRTNLTGAFYVLKEAGQIFERQRYGAVVLIGSRSGEQGMPGQAAYAASKAGLIGLMRSAAREWGNLNIRINAIFPGWHSSPLAEPGRNFSMAHQTHILNRAPSLESVATNVYHLAENLDISGQIWDLDNRI